MGIIRLLGEFYEFVQETMSLLFFLVRAPYDIFIILRSIPRDETDDYDISKLILLGFYAVMLFFFVAYLYKYTDYLQATYNMIVDTYHLSIDYSWKALFFILNNFFLAVLVALLVFLAGGAVYIALKRRRDRKYRYLEETDDVDESFHRMERELAQRTEHVRGWGPRAYVSNDPDFVAPSRFVKIRGMMFLNATSRQRMRLNMEIKKKMGIVVQGDLCWTNFYDNEQLLTLFIEFHTIEKATEAFHKMNGFFFDG